LAAATFHANPSSAAFEDPRFQTFNDFLSVPVVSRGKLTGVINVQLNERLETRKIVERAKGILQRDLGLTEEEAHLTIQRQSRQRRKSKKEIAEAIILGDQLRKAKG
jgi:uroporphyrinogen-III synthase